MPQTVEMRNYVSVQVKCPYCGGTFNEHWGVPDIEALINAHKTVLVYDSKHVEKISK